MKKYLMIGFALSILSHSSYAQLTPGPSHGSSGQLIQDLDVAKYDIRSTLQYLSNSGALSNTASSYLNDAIQKIERVQSALNSSGPVAPNPPPHQPPVPSQMNLQVGDLVYKGTAYTMGAKIEALNLSQGRATIRSLKSGNIFTESISDLSLTRGCLSNICVGSKVYKGTSYSLGAIVLGINLNSRTVVIKSLKSGNLFEESASDLDLAN